MSKQRKPESPRPPGWMYYRLLERKGSRQQFEFWRKPTESDKIRASASSESEQEIRKVIEELTGRKYFNLVKSP